MAIKPKLSKVQELRERADMAPDSSLQEEADPRGTLMFQTHSMVVGWLQAFPDVSLTAKKHRRSNYQTGDPISNNAS